MNLNVWCKSTALAINSRVPCSTLEQTQKFTFAAYYVAAESGASDFQFVSMWNDNFIENRIQISVSSDKNQYYSFARLTVEEWTDEFSPKLKINSISALSTNVINAEKLLL